MNNNRVGGESLERNDATWSQNLVDRARALSNPIPLKRPFKVRQSSVEDYADRSEAFNQMLSTEDCTQPGDVEKAVSIILDLVRREGVATGKEIPFRPPPRRRLL
jgi:hypothetical protein